MTNDKGDMTSDEPGSGTLDEPILPLNQPNHMLSLYVHIPFCEHKCIYCSFYSIESVAGKDRFLAALDREIGMVGEGKGRPEVSTLFFGGGTPSMLSPEEIGGIIDRLREFYRFTDDAEITMECNPGALNREWLEGYRDAGINRLSFGVQSFDDDELRFLTRIHTAEEAEKNIRLVRSVFDNVSLDLIFALPGQSVEGWMENLRRGVELGTDHISAYALIFEEGTPLNAMRLKGRVAPAENDLEGEMYERTVAYLDEVGFRQYETSNYARPGFACRHNVAYWERRPYDAFGPSAHSFTDDRTYGTRRANVSSLSAYLAALESERSPVVTVEQLTQIEAIEEVVLLGLRYRGIELAELARVSGRPIDRAAPRTLERVLSHSYAELTPERLTLTPEGSIFADRLALEFVREIEQRMEAERVG